MKPCRGDWVRCTSDMLDPKWIGFVKRCAKDGTWADVLWHLRGTGTWGKRMLCNHLRVVTEINIGDGIVICDLTRKQEAEGHGDEDGTRRSR